MVVCIILDYGGVRYLDYGSVHYLDYDGMHYLDYGGVHYLDKPVEVEEGEILSFHFSNFTQKHIFVYVLCLEETGEIKHVMMDVAEPPYVAKSNKTQYPIMKKLIQTYIPKGEGGREGELGREGEGES